MKLTRVYCALVVLCVGCGSDDDTEVLVTKTVGKAGGTVATTDGHVSLTIPAGALPKDTPITIQPTADYPEDNGAIPGTFFEFGPDGTTFDEPVKLTIAYDPKNIPAGIEEDSLRLYKVQGSNWLEIADSSVDTKLQVVTALVSSFSTYGIRADPSTPSDMGAEASTDAGVEIDTGIVDSAPLDTVVAPDMTVDTTVDMTVDTTIDMTVDTVVPPDVVTVDTVLPPDTTVDTTVDVTVDTVVPPDTTVDTTVDMTVDTTVDMTVDTTVDMTVDTTVDGPGAICPNTICEVGESCDGRGGTVTCLDDCDGNKIGNPTHPQYFCWVDGVCEGPAC